ncbi:MAG: hypothetical protein HKN08_09265, partial [Gammaproteobacteria bacterium]|nr:hypothetical protein [Gammaproteobacteria bacterium]
MKKIICYLFILLISNLSAQETTGEMEPGILINNYVNKTALFVGEHITYTIEVICNADVDILPEDLAEDELILNGLELISSNIDMESSGSRTRYTFSYVLATYAGNATPLGIDELRVRYYFKRPGQRIEDVATVGDVSISSVDLVLASTLPADLENLELRDIQAPSAKSTNVDWIGTAGILLVLVSMFPVGSAAYAWMQKRKLEKQAEQARETVSVKTNVFNELRAIDISDESNRRQAFQKLEAVIREFIWQKTGLTLQA